MASWYSSWFSGLPTFDFAVPSSIQRRFFSFLLKRTLGHFLKPGQLDLHQIDSQLGSGTVQVKDLELDGQAINQLLEGLPIALYDGFISGVTARIPFPNPLSSSVGVHVQSLNLTFHITPEQLSSHQPVASNNTSNLADSVVSVAETFIHDELTPREEATLRQSLKPSAGPPPPLDESDNLPGGFGPPTHNLPPAEVRGEPRGDDDPAGVSVFATLIERLLAKFEFSAKDTKITIVYPGRTSFSLIIPEIAYHTSTRQPPHSESGSQSQPAAEGSERSGQIHTVSISGLKVTYRDLRIVASSPSATSTASPISMSSSRESPQTYRKPLINPLSRSSSSSSLDEETQLMMSQSIAVLPPRSPSPSSVSGSMYQSAVSMTQTQHLQSDISPTPTSNSQITEAAGHPRIRPRISIPSQGIVEELLLSFGSQPIVLNLQTPSRPAKTSEEVLQDVADHASAEISDRESREREVFQLAITVGTLACVFHSCHLRAFLDTLDACIYKLPASPVPRQKDASPTLPLALFSLEANMVVRAIVVLVLPGHSTEVVHDLGAYFERPLVPPRLPCTYARLFLNSLSTSFQLFQPSSDTSLSTPPASSPKPVSWTASGRVALSDMSLFAFHSLSSSEDPQVAAPILITDHHLPVLDAARLCRPSFSSEMPGDVVLPHFDVVDWTEAKFKGASAKLSTWRSRSRATNGKADKLHTPSHRSSGLPSSSSPFIASPLSEAEDKLPTPPVIEVYGQVVPAVASKQSSQSAHIRIAPLHLFLDLDMIFKENIVMGFLGDVTSATIFAPRTVPTGPGVGKGQAPRLENVTESSEDDGDVDTQVRHMSPRARQREEERKRLEALVLEDLDLGMTYQPIDGSSPKATRRKPVEPKRKRKAPSNPALSVNLTCPVIRIEVCCPPPPNRPRRSGCLLLDLRGLTVSNTPPPTKPSLRFVEGTKTQPVTEGIPNLVLNAGLQQILVGYSSVRESVAHTVIALGSLPTHAGPDTSALLASEFTRDTSPLSLVMGGSDVKKDSMGTPSSRLLMTVDIPLVNLLLDKALLDGLQYWADDAAQLIERSFASHDSATETLPSRNPSLIGSRYFAQTRRSGAHSTDESTVGTSERPSTGETVVQLGIAEALIRFMVPRSDESHNPRPFDISALGIDALIELKPEGREETTVTAGVMDLRIADTSNDGNYTPLLAPSSSNSPVGTRPQFYTSAETRPQRSAPRPTVKTRITSLVVPDTTAKESRIRLSLWGFIIHVPPDLGFVSDLMGYAKAPPGVFESVVPSECTRLTIAVADVSVHVRAPDYLGAAVLYLGEAEFATELDGNSVESAFKLSTSSSHILLVDSIHDALESTEPNPSSLGRGVNVWKNSGYALIAEITQTQLAFRADNSMSPPSTSVVIDPIDLRLHLCADTISALTGLITSLTHTPKEFAGDEIPPAASRVPSTLAGDAGRDMTASLDELAFKVLPEVGSMADLISDDLPSNLDYLDASFGTAAGLRELRDDDLEDFDTEEQTGHDTPVAGQLGIVSNLGGETIRILKPFSFVEHHFDTISPEAVRDVTSHSDDTSRIRIHNSSIVIFLHDGFDWPRTRKIIEKEVKEMRKRLARIRQLVATGQTQESIDETTSATLFNSFHIGLEQDLENMDSDTLIAAIDDELDDTAETGSESSWQSLQPPSPGRPRAVSARVHGKRLTRSKGPSIEIRLEGMNAEIDTYRPGATLVSRTLILLRDLEILDHIKTSTWKKFLTDMRSDSRGNVRETDSNMARIELLSVRPSPSHPAEEARLRAKILPLRLYVDQDALDFFKKFFAFKDPDSPSTPDDGDKGGEIYFQHAEVFPVDLKLDYKPRRVDYRALREGRTIELMNFFHFDGAEMTLRHLTLHGITGWPRFFDTLNDLWTPDVKATQLVDVISGVAPIRSVVNVGSGVADLVLLPIAQYKKDGRIVRGVQKGTKAFVQSTAMEAIKLGARLATGTQVILEQAESVLGGQFKDSVTAEALQIPYENEYAEDEDLISRYATQPSGIKEGVQSAYHSLQRNLHSAAQTILAVPMEVYERSGNEGAVRAVVRAVPIAVLKPMIGASEAVSKTLMGLHNTLDPNVRLENEAKYKHR